MIQSWADGAAEAVFNGEAPKGFPSGMVKRTRRLLARLDAASSVEELRTPPGNRLHKLTGDRASQWSLSVSDPFRVCFIWGDHGPERVEFTDYH